MEPIIGKSSAEWLRQADYDLDTAQYIFDGGRYFYAIFMCHLAVEKALKGLHVAKLFSEPPRTHSLTYITERLGIQIPEETGKFLAVLAGLSVPTR